MTGPGAAAPPGVRDQFGMPSAINVERCPPSRRNAVRHQSGTVSAIAWNTQLTRLCLRGAPGLGRLACAYVSVALPALEKLRETVARKPFGQPLDECLKGHPAGGAPEDQLDDVDAA